MAWNWAGTDIGKAHHHTVVLNNDGVLTPEGELTAEPRVMTGGPIWPRNGRGRPTVCMRGS
jgi:hypothetical protein